MECREPRKLTRRATPNPESGRTDADSRGLKGRWRGTRTA